jgi:hypothetical protein
VPDQQAAASLGGDRQHAICVTKVPIDDRANDLARQLQGMNQHGIGALHDFRHAG